MSSFLPLGPEGWGEVQGKIAVPVVTVDRYCGENAVSRIDVLKIDTQGFDFEVLKGADRMLSNAQIRLVSAESSSIRTKLPIGAMNGAAAGSKYTMNALDHVSNLRVTCSEILRIIARGGMFIGSFNLLEKPAFSEPQTLTEEKPKAALLRHMEVQFYRAAPPGPKDDTYGPFFEGKYIDKPIPGARLWVRAIKAL